VMGVHGMRMGRRGVGREIGKVGEGTGMGG